MGDLLVSRQVSSRSSRNTAAKALMRSNRIKNEARFQANGHGHGRGQGHTKSGRMVVIFLTWSRRQHESTAILSSWPSWPSWLGVGGEVQGAQGKGDGERVEGGGAHLARWSYSAAATPASNDMRTRAFSDFSEASRVRFPVLRFIFGICRGVDSLSLFLAASSPPLIRVSAPAGEPLASASSILKSDKPVYASSGASPQGQTHHGYDLSLLSQAFLVRGTEQSSLGREQAWEFEKKGPRQRLSNRSGCRRSTGLRENR